LAEFRPGAARDASMLTATISAVTLAFALLVALEL
jgi:hypothetical protein